MHKKYILTPSYNATFVHLFFTYLKTDLQVAEQRSRNATEENRRVHVELDHVKVCVRVHCVASIVQYKCIHMHFVYTEVFSTCKQCTVL